jgi:hypothetical protein
VAPVDLGLLVGVGRLFAHASLASSYSSGATSAGACCRASVGSSLIVTPYTGRPYNVAFTRSTYPKNRLPDAVAATEDGRRRGDTAARVRFDAEPASPRPVTAGEGRTDPRA